ncbi:MAG: hypothetical protein Q7T55_02965 [Solirubrobacteraceae bacterium]|nr:hypothetical protein [Solirubrobacteraceae bacterium]
MNSRVRLPLIAAFAGIGLTAASAGAEAHAVPIAAPAGTPWAAATAPAQDASAHDVSARAASARAAATIARAATPPVVPALLPTRYLRGGPHFLADGRVAWLEADGQDWGIRAGIPGSQAANTLISGRLHHDSDDESGEFSDDVIASDFAAAGTMGVVSLGDVEGSIKAQVYSAGSEVRAYDLASGRFRALDVCTRRTEGFEPSPPLAAFATDGEHVAVSLCTDTKIYDATGATPIATLPTNPYRLDIAGPYVATADGGAATVRNWTTGQTVYTTKIPVSADHVGFSVQSDGALAVVTVPSPASGGQAELSWHTPADPDGTVLPVKPATASVEARGGKAIVSVASLSGLGNVVTEIGPAAPELRLAFVGFDAAPDFGYLDGRVAFGRSGCDGAGGVGLATGDASPVATTCPDLVVRRAKRTGRRLGVSVTYRPGVTEPLRVTYRAGKRTLRFSITPRPGTSGADAKFRLPAWAVDKRATLTVAHRGSPLFISQTVQRRVHG